MAGQHFATSDRDGNCYVIPVSNVFEWLAFLDAVDEWRATPELGFPGIPEWAHMVERTAAERHVRELSN